MLFPPFADFPHDGDHTSQDNREAALRSAMNVGNFTRIRSSPTSVTVEGPLRLSVCRSSSEKQLESLSRCGSTVSRSDSTDSLWRVSDLPAALELAKHVEVFAYPGPLKRERPTGSTPLECPVVEASKRARAGPREVQGGLGGGTGRNKIGVTFKLPRRARAVLPEWPAVDDDAFASSKKHLLTFDLDPTTLPTDVLCHLALEMFVSAGLPAGLAEHRVRRFILAVRASMLDNPYHNFYHVFDVMQTTNALATSTGTIARLDSWERFALLSAALCHDMEHPGVTSQFLSKAAGAATRGKYRDIILRDALLEKHHALCAFEFMCARDVGILEGLSSAQYYQFRSSVSKIILATDMKRHGEYFEQLQEFATRRAQDPAVEMDKQLAMELMVKCADISNVVKPAAVARRWALRVTDEFFLQGDAEREMGMEVSPNCDRLAKSRVAIQTGFIDYLAAPLFDLLAAVFPREGLDIPLENLGDNRASYAFCSDLDLEKARDWEDVGVDQ